MGQDYWLGRQRASFMLATKVSSAEAKLIHYQMAGVCSVKAARSAEEAGSVWGKLKAPVADAEPSKFSPDTSERHYRELSQGAEHLASEAVDAVEIAEHQRMAAAYLHRAREAAWGERLSS
jgi:hypothetical protein